MHEHADKKIQLQLCTAKAGFSACKRALLHSTLMPEAAVSGAHHASAQQMHCTCAGGPKASGFTHLADIEARHDPSQELLALIKSQK